VLAFGNPDLGDAEKNLEFAELEAKEVKAAYPESSVYIRKEATEKKRPKRRAKPFLPTMTFFTLPPMQN
jgi:hypothetical protein